MARLPETHDRLLCHLVKHCQRNCCPMRGDDPSCIKEIETRHCRYFRLGKIKLYKSLEHPLVLVGTKHAQCVVTVHDTELL